jgi:hypothetical protein
MSAIAPPGFSSPVAGMGTSCRWTPEILEVHPTRVRIRVAKRSG